VIFTGALIKEVATWFIEVTCGLETRRLITIRERVIETFARSFYPTLVKSRVQDTTRVSITVDVTESPQRTYDIAHPLPDLEARHYGCVVAGLQSVRRLQLTVVEFACLHFKLL